MNKIREAAKKYFEEELSGEPLYQDSVIDWLTEFAERQITLPIIDLEVCERLALDTDYACWAVGEEINTGDAGAFFLEGYMYAKKLLSDIISMN